MSDCIFCRIATNTADAVIVYEDADLVAFLDIRPIRPGHTLIITRSHVPTFDELDADLAARIMSLGQQLARRMKTVYRVCRVGFVFTGTDVPHVHAHIIPMHEPMDITSARYAISAEPVRWSSDHLAVHAADLEAVRRELEFRAEP